MLKLDIQRMILNYVESLDGYATYLGGDEYLFLLREEYLNVKREATN